ncbi:MAG: CobW family GTP-binding protein [Burkholderiaceae bacterium]
MVTASTAGRPRLPLTVIGGFLGAGKTTLLNRLLRESQGRRWAVLVNDFGALNIDAELVASNAGDTIALTNGCVCCSIGDDLTAALIEVLESPAPFDAVVIEASGVSDPWRIAQVALADPALSLDGVIVLVDASACMAHIADPLLTDSLQRQIKAADLVVLNKTDLVDAEERQRVRDWLASVASKTPRLETTQASMPLPLLSGSALSLDRRAQVNAGIDADGVPNRAAYAGESEKEHGHSGRHDHDHGDLFETWSCQPACEFSAKVLRALLRDMPAGVLRLKGVLRTDEHDWAELQFAGRHGSLRKAFAPPVGGAAVVAIGLRHQLPSQALSATFSANSQDVACGLPGAS